MEERNFESVASRGSTPSRQIRIWPAPNSSTTTTKGKHMPQIHLPEGISGILGPMDFRPETAKPLNEFAEVSASGTELADARRTRVNRDECFVPE